MYITQLLLGLTALIIVVAAFNLYAAYLKLLNYLSSLYIRLYYERMYKAARLYLAIYELIKPRVKKKVHA